MTTLLLIRHGESRANRSGLFAGHFNAELEDNGVMQAKLTAKYIAENYKVDKIYSSDLKRAHKTAACLSELLDIEIIPNKNLREINAGKWEGVKYSELTTIYPKEYDIWLNDIGNAGCVGGETVKQLGERIISTLTQIAEENNGKTIAVATHATPIRAFQTLVEYGTLEKMKDIPWVSNSSITVVQYSNGEWILVDISKDDHLGEIKTLLPSNV